MLKIFKTLKIFKIFKNIHLNWAAENPTKRRHTAPNVTACKESECLIYRESKYVEMKTHQVCKEWWHGLLHRSTVESTVINLREAIISCSGATPPPSPCPLVVLITLSYNYSCNHMQCEDPTKYHGAFPCSLSVVTLMNRARCCWSALSYTLPPPKQSHHAICLMHQISPLSLLSIDLHHQMITTPIATARDQFPATFTQRQGIPCTTTMCTNITDTMA